MILWAVPRPQEGDVTPSDVTVRVCTNFTLSANVLDVSAQLPAMKQNDAQWQQIIVRFPYYTFLGTFNHKRT